MQVLKVCQNFLLLIVFLSASFVLAETEEELIFKGYSADTPGKSIEYFTQAISINPNYKIAYLYRGQIKMEIENINGAIEDFTKAIEISPRFVPAYIARATAKKLKGDLEGAKQDLLLAKQEKGDYQLEEINTTILSDPNNAQLYLGRANYKFQKEDYTGAIQDYDKYINLVGIPNDISIYHSRAYAKNAIGDISGAIADYTLAIEHFPNEYNYKKRAEFKITIGDIEGAKADKLEAQRLYKEGVIEEIQILYQKLENIEIIPVEERTHSKISILEWIASKKIDIKDYAGAIIDLNNAIAIKPSVGFFKLRAKAKKAMGDMEGYEADILESLWVDRREKLQLLNQTLEFNPQDVDALIERAIIWIYVKEYNKALEDSDKAIKIDSSSTEALKVRAKAKKKLGDSRGSIADRRLIWQIQNNQ